MSSVSEERAPIRGIELAMAALIAVECLAVNAVAVSELPELSLEALGPFVIVYHDKQPSLVLLPLLIGLLLLVKHLPAVGRAAALVFVGAAAANVASPSIWRAGVPDYIVVRELDLIANLSDLLMIAAGLVIVGSIGVDGVRRGLRRRSRST